MEKKIEWTKDKIFRLALFCACQLFCLITFVHMLMTARGEMTKVLICVLSMLCLCAPTVVGKLLKFRITTPVYVFIMIYAVTPMLGHAYNLYYLIPWWDTLLHTTGGVVFALFGAYLPRLFFKNKECDPLLCALFGLVFSIAVAAVWEFIEYGCDMLLGTDMQQDAFITNLHSYLLGGDMGIIGKIDGVESVIVNGVEIGGYIDVGVIDTMTDMIFETLGAIAYTVAYLIDKGKHTSLQPIVEAKRAAENIKE